VWKGIEITAEVKYFKRAHQFVPTKNRKNNLCIAIQDTAEKLGAQIHGKGISKFRHYFCFHLSPFLK